MFALKRSICLLWPAHEFYKNGVKLLNCHFATTASSYNRHESKYNAVKLPIEESYNHVKGKYSDIPYKMLDPNSAAFTSYMIKVKSRRTRYQNKLIMLEGRRLIDDALVAGVQPVMILFTRKNLVKDLPLIDRYITPNKTVLHKIPYHHIQNWSDLTTSPGITGIFKMPDLSQRSMDFPTLPITLVCDNVREPGNLGAILRVAAAAPVRKVMLTEGCVDLWDTKVTRSSCGAMFNLCVENNVTWEDIRDTCQGNVIIADHIIPLDDTKTSIIAEAYPSAEDIDSENLEKEEEESDDDDDDEDELMDKNEIRSAYSVPTAPYYNVSYKNYDSFVVVIGGETEGLSEECFRFAKDNNGLRVNIPLAPCVNSLNTATALGIITFEIKRQLECT